MILLCLALSISYLTTFVSYFDNKTDEHTVFSEETREYLVFLLFWSGFYCGYTGVSYLQVTYPFYVLLALVIVERLAQIWTENRFGCSAE